MANPEILNWLANRREPMIELLADIVNIDSNSYDKAGVDRVAARLRAHLERSGIECTETPVSDGGNALHARLPGDGGNAPVLLMGHMDTVFPSDEVSRRPFVVEDGRGYGPGCADMKAGLVMNAFILQGFAETGESPFPLHALFTGDEEIGSPASRPIIEAAAREACAVFNAEPGRTSGNVVSGRRGGTFFRVEVTGRAAHAGLNPADGRSAIHELADKIVAWRGLNDVERDVSVNVGLVSGGQSVNTVAPNASAEIDLRFTHPEDEQKIADEIERIAADCAEEGVSATFKILGGFSPILQSPAGTDLTALYLSAARDLGQSTDAEFTRSCADSGVASMTGTPVVCATGPVGGKAHSPDEYVELDTFVPRAQAVALSILRLAEKRREA